MTETISGREARTPLSGPPPAESLRLLEMLTGTWISQSLYIVARFDIADRIGDGARTADELAAAAGLDPVALFRIMRAAAAAGIFAQRSGGEFELTELGRYLRSDVPGTQKYSAVLFGEETFRSWADVEYTARTGRPAFDNIHGESFYDYLTKHPAAGAVFNRVMGTAGAVPPIAHAFDFAPYRHAVDVGGGVGALLADILRTHQDLVGTVVDLAETAGEAEEYIAAAGLADRCGYHSGSFFEPLVSGDVYLLSRVLHNWGDEDVARILANVRDAIIPGGRVLVFERFLPNGDEFHMGKIFDLVMMVMLGGRERTAEEYTGLLAAAGFDVVERRSGPAGIGMLVAEPISRAG